MTDKAKVHNDLRAQGYMPFAEAGTLSGLSMVQLGKLAAEGSIEARLGVRSKWVLVESLQRALGAERAAAFEKARAAVVADARPLPRRPGGRASTKKAVERFAAKHTQYEDAGKLLVELLDKGHMAFKPGKAKAMKDALDLIRAALEATAHLRKHVQVNSRTVPPDVIAASMKL